MYPADYPRHEVEYRRRRAAGHAGWNTATAAEECPALLEQVFPAPRFSRTGRLLETWLRRGDFSLWAAGGRGHEVEGSGQLSGCHPMGH